MALSSAGRAIACDEVCCFLLTARVFLLLAPAPFAELDSCDDCLWTFGGRPRPLLGKDTDSGWSSVGGFDWVASFLELVFDRLVGLGFCAESLVSSRGLFWFEDCGS